VSRNIIILPKEVREKIRAGEVVERPASCVKELIENSIDAGSNRIVCEIERGGMGRIKVADDGVGMSPENLFSSVERYATSKIKCIDDISRISTFGFRGEALPSIRAVSEMVVESRTESQETGFLIRMQGEEVIEKRPQSRKVGTTVDIRRLFFNTPARRKFVKSESVEFRHIRRVFTALAIGNRDIHFTLFNNGSLSLDIAPSSDLKRRVGNLVRGDTREHLVSLIEDNRGIRINGVVLMPEYGQSGRDFQYIIVNKRWVMSNLIRKAIYKAYGNSLWGKHPIFVVEITIPGDEIDINVHPTKKEVKFSEERVVFETVFSAVSKTLSDKKTLPDVEKEVMSFVSEGTTGYGKDKVQIVFPTKEEEQIFKREVSMPKDFWQLHNSYIFASTKTGFMIVDQHAAHERIIFDRIVRRKKSIPPQMLLFSLRVELSIKEEEFLEDSIQDLYELGFRIKKFSGKTIVVEGVPPFMKEIDETIIHELLQDIIESAGSENQFIEIAKQIACKSAIKAGQELKQVEMNELFDNLFATDNPFSCPHGRPTIIKFPLKELEKKFKRR